MKKSILHVVAFVTLLFSCNINFAQAPDLGTAAGFVLFSSNGAISNTGLTNLTGNVGTNTGAITGFGNVNGVMHNNDVTTASAKTDLLSAYNQLNLAIPTLFPGFLLGNGDTLNAGIYSISENTTLNLTLTLNGQGDSNAVFIFKIQGTFSTNTSSKIVLINGAQACNVFWKAEGLVSMAPGTFMRGNVIANNAAINMNPGDTLEGRALSTTGAVSVNGVFGYIPTGCGKPLLAGPAAPDLASTACYALFSGNGGLSNVGITNVTGDIGTNAGLTAGYNPLNVNGTIHLIPDTSTIACANDLLTVYNYLNNLPHDIELLYPAQFGHNLVLTPHTYLMSAATAFTDTLYLNAEGNASAVFVIKITGALSTSTFAKVLLINGAQAKNVFWKVDGAVDISDNSVFKGTIICNNGAVSLKTGVDLEGRALTTSGAFSTSSITAAITDGCDSTLPVTWLSFTAEKNTNTSVLLKWASVNEINSHHYDVERSSDGRNFITLGSVAAANNFSAVQRYSFTENKTINGTNFYRLKQVDLDGKFNYSAVVKVNMAGALWLTFPNPATNKTTIQIRSRLSNVSVTLINYNGKSVYYSFLKNLNAGEFKDIPLYNLPRGIYMLKIESDKGSKTEKIIVQ